MLHGLIHQIKAVLSNFADELSDLIDCGLDDAECLKVRTILQRLHDHLASHPGVQAGLADVLHVAEHYFHWNNASVEANPRDARREHLHRLRVSRRAMFRRYAFRSSSKPSVENAPFCKTAFEILSEFDGVTRPPMSRGEAEPDSRDLPRKVLIYLKRHGVPRPEKVVPPIDLKRPPAFRKTAQSARDRIRHYSS